MPFAAVTALSGAKHFEHCKFLWYRKLHYFFLLSWFQVRFGGGGVLCSHEEQEGDAHAPLCHSKGSVLVMDAGPCFEAKAFCSNEEKKGDVCASSCLSAIKAGVCRWWMQDCVLKPKVVKKRHVKQKQVQVQVHSRKKMTRVLKVVKHRPNDAAFKAHWKRFHCVSFCRSDQKLQMCIVSDLFLCAPDAIPRLLWWVATPLCQRGFGQNQAIEHDVRPTLSEFMVSTFIRSWAFCFVFRYHYSQRFGVVKQVAVLFWMDDQVSTLRPGQKDNGAKIFSGSKTFRSYATIS